MSDKSVAKVWTFKSDSNPNKSYETLQYSDSSTSCQCPGWTRRVTSDGNRSCKHTRLIDQGLADSHCVSSHDYDTSVNNPVAKTAVKTAVKTAPHKMEAAPVRKINWQ
jgi:hypothetical protein